MQRTNSNLQRDKCVGFGPPVPQKWVCLECRIVVKPALTFWPRTAAPFCTRCKSKLLFAGKAFRAPRRSDLKGWRKVALLVQSGFVFYPDAARRIPKNPNALPDWQRQRAERFRRNSQEQTRYDNERNWKQKQRAAAWRATERRLLAEVRAEKAARNETEYSASTCRRPNTLK